MSKNDWVPALLAGNLVDGFANLGIHGESYHCFYPGADEIAVIAETGESVQLDAVHPDGLFGKAHCKTESFQNYSLQVVYGESKVNCHDPYRFESALLDDDLWLFAEGNHHQAWRMLGAHVITHMGVSGVHFSVWAPNARRVAVVGEFNAYDGRTHIMRYHPGAGVWDMFVPELDAGERYRFEILGADGQRTQRADPFAQQMLSSSDSLALVVDSQHEWSDAAWVESRESQTNKPMSVYEVHASSWRRDLSAEQFSTQLLSYVQQNGFTHVQFMPLSEHPFTGSWGYQVLGIFALTERFGTPDQFKSFVDRAHEQHIGVLLDWVPAHFPRDPHGLVRFDGTALYEHADPRQGAHPDWGTLIFNYGRSEVLSYLISSAHFWIKEYHVDGLRVDAVASMLYLDYSRDEGEWVPNKLGGRENLEAVQFLQRLNQSISSAYPGVIVIAEESTAWPGVTASVDDGGLGFTQKWNMGWMHDTLAYLQHEPIHRRYHHNQITFSMVYAYSEQFVLPISHDEVVHGKGSLVSKMPGDRWQQFANLRLLLSYMWAHPGKKHLFMGCEFGQWAEWNHDGELHWHLLGEADHKGALELVKTLNHMYKTLPELSEWDSRVEGFNWLVADDSDNSVLAFSRHNKDAELMVVLNMTPVVREDYVLPMSTSNRFEAILNSDDVHFGGGGVGLGEVTAATYHDGRPGLKITLPPLAALYLKRVDD